MADVAVVIPARDAAATLPRTLAALAAQTFAGTVDVAVVDDRSTDGTGAVARAAGARVLTSDGAGPAQARNAGAAATSAPLLAFTDADCEPAPDWLERAVVRLRAGADLVQGAIRPVPGVPVGPYDRTLWAERPSGLFQTANLLVTRAAFERAGGFPPIPGADTPGRGLRLEPGEKSFGEDALFGWAVRRCGARIAWAPDAVVHHAVFRRGPRGYIAERERLRFFPGLVREVPELRRELAGRVFLSPRSAAFDVAAAGALAALATRRPLLAAAALPYVLATGTARHPRRLAVFVAADAVGLAALLRGSAAARTPVL